MIRKATIKDIDHLDTLVNSAYRGESSKKGWTTEEHLLGGIRTDKSQLKHNIEDTSNHFYVFEEDGQIKACINLTDKRPKLYLGTLTVNPNLQGSGLGKKLLSFAIDFAKDHHYEAIEMTVISVRTELIAWYERHGYVRTGERRPFPMHDPNFGQPKQFLEFVVLEQKL